MARSSSSKASTQNTSALRLVRAALELIESNGGCRGVNLRQIAAKAGCAHTNAYNYFDSLEDLLWAAMDKALNDALQAITNMAGRTPSKSASLGYFLRFQVAYAQKHPSLYRLVWLEPLAGTPPPSVLRGVDEMRTTWVRKIAGHLSRKQRPNDLIWIGQIVHGYFHGEVCKLVGRRAFAPTASDDSDRIVRNTLDLVGMIDRCPKKK